MDLAPDIFTCPEGQITWPILRDFVQSAIATKLQAESLVLEFKSAEDGMNVIRSAAAMANTDGGLVLVGVDEAPSDGDHFPGATKNEVDATTQRFRALTPQLMPEVICVAIDDKPGRAIVVLRIDADQIDRPIPVNGMVAVRVPGHNKPAHRDEIVALVLESRSGGAPMTSLPMDVGNIRLHQDRSEPSIEIRVLSTLTLPRRLRRLPWIGTPAVEGVREALEESPVPHLLDADRVRTHERAVNNWDIVESTSQRAVYEASAQPSVHRGRASYAARAQLLVTGQYLQCLVSVTVAPGDQDVEVHLRVPVLRDVLLAGAAAATSAARRCAAEIGAGHPVAAPVIGAWAGGPVGLTSLKVTLPPGHRIEQGQQRPDRRFDDMQPGEETLEAFESVVRVWVTQMLFDQGILGVEEIVGGPLLPKWAQPTPT